MHPPRIAGQTPPLKSFGPGGRRRTLDILDYDELVTDFETKLITQLRGHGTEADYLEMWVPDDDAVKSLINMIEAAGAYGRDNIAIRIASERMAGNQLTSLATLAGDLCKISIEADTGTMLIRVTEIKPQ